MKLGILGAMLEEVSCIEKLMEVSNRKEIGSRTYLEGSISGMDVVLTFSRWGKVASASTTTTLINLFNVDFVLFTGVAGAVHSDLNIGDVVISNGLYQHDMDARPIFERFQVPLTNTKVFEPNIEDIFKATQASKQFLSQIHEIISKDTLSKYSILNPCIHQGLIASGDKFVTNPSKHEELHYKHADLESLAVEMEGAAVAQVCSDYEIPFIIIRTISDKADHSAVKDFQSFIRDVASKYSAGIIRNFVTNLVSKSMDLPGKLSFSSVIKELSSERYLPLDVEKE